MTGRAKNNLDYAEPAVGRLISRLGELELVIGFNVKRFDYAVLSAYTPHNLQKLPTLDLLEDVQRQLGFRLSLQALGEAP